MTELIFVRHGETQTNVAGTWQGWSDPPLNSTGRAQAEATADRLAAESTQIGALYTSPLRRALRTAQTIGEHLALEPRLVEQLKEIHFGDLEGITVKQMENEYPELYRRWQDKTDLSFQWPGGERRGDFFGRAADACKHICQRHVIDTVVIVAHGGTIRACLAYLLPDLLGQWWGYPLDNAGLTRVQATDAGAQLLTLNNTQHLSAGRRDPVPG